MERLAPDSFGWFHPGDEEELARLIVDARGVRRVRVRGAHHSVPATVAGDDDLIVVLDAFQQLRYNEATGEVTAGAGIRLGPDPLNPRRAGDQGLCLWLHERGRALSNLGGILHQTLGGFLQTGSAGGSARFDAAAAVTGLRLVDGRGHVHVWRRGQDDDWIDAALVSLGSCGVITEVTMQTEPAYDVAGTETVWPDRGAAVDLCADDERGLAAFFGRTDYARVLWWPQRSVRRIVVWQAERASRAGEAPRGYDPLPRVLGSLQPMQVAAGGVLWALVHWRRPFRVFGTTVTRWLERVATPIEGVIYRAFVDGDPAAPQRFNGAWFEILPQDQHMDERWMPTTFTEIFVPLARAAEALRRLNALFDADPSSAGQFAIELYAAPASRSWLHPAYQQPSLRINVFWLMHAPGDPRDSFFPRIWAALEDLAPRLHWGKLFPHTSADMVVGRYPRLHEFLSRRDTLDPDRVLASAWLASALGIAKVVPATPLPRRRMPRRRRAWPLYFGLQPSDRTLVDAADYVFDVTRTIAASPEDALFALFEAKDGDGAPGLRGFTWFTPENVLATAVVDEEFVFMSIRLRTVEYVPGRLLVLTVDRCSMPLARRLVQVFEVEPEGDGCRMRWRVAITYRPDTRWLAPVVRPLFARLFNATINRVKRRFETKRFSFDSLKK